MAGEKVIETSEDPITIPDGPGREKTLEEIKNDFLKSAPIFQELTIAVRNLTTVIARVEARSGRRDVFWIAMLFLVLLSIFVLGAVVWQDHQQLQSLLGARHG